MVETKRDRTVERLQLQQIIAGMTEGIILIDPDGTLSWTNEAALQMHGVEAVQELGRNVEQYAIDTSSDTSITTRSSMAPIRRRGCWRARCSRT